MNTEIILGLGLGFLVFITLIRRETLKEVTKPLEHRSEIRRHNKRRSHKGRRIHEFHINCETRNRRKIEERRYGSKDRRYKSRRHTLQAA